MTKTVLFQEDEMDELQRMVRDTSEASLRNIEHGITKVEIELNRDSAFHLKHYLSTYILMDKIMVALTTGNSNE